MYTQKVFWPQVFLITAAAVAIIPLMFVSNGYRFGSGLGNVLLIALTLVWAGAAFYSGLHLRRLESDERWLLVLAGVIAPVIAVFVAKGVLGPYPDDESAFVANK